MDEAANAGLDEPPRAFTLRDSLEAIVATLFVFIYQQILKILIFARRWNY